MPQYAGVVGGQIPNQVVVAVCKGKGEIRCSDLLFSVGDIVSDGKRMCIVASDRDLIHAHANTKEKYSLEFVGVALSASRNNEQISVGVAGEFTVHHNIIKPSVKFHAHSYLLFTCNTTSDTWTHRKPGWKPVCATPVSTTTDVKWMGHDVPGKKHHSRILLTLHHRRFEEEDEEEEEDVEEDNNEDESVLEEFDKVLTAERVAAQIGRPAAGGKRSTPPAYPSSAKRSKASGR
jgi:hypothetical protein